MHCDVVIARKTVTHIWIRSRRASFSTSPFNFSSVRLEVRVQVLLSYPDATEFPLSSFLNPISLSYPRYLNLGATVYF